MIPYSALAFIENLKNNNNREWFNEHKSEFLQQQAFMEQFATELLQALNVHDAIETPTGKKGMQRIYRDTRFSLDKTPYKSYWGGAFKRASAQRRGGYYYHIESGKTFVACGFWGPNTEDLKRIRKDIAFDAAPLREILENPTFIQNFGKLEGEQLKSMPRGFPVDHPAIDLLKYKQFLVFKRFTDEEVLSKDFVQKVNNAVEYMRPFLDYMSEVLVTEL